MNQLTVEIFKAMMRNALIRISEREDEFSRLDAVIGDGDHGTAIVAAVKVAAEAAEKGTEFKNLLNDMGFQIMLNTSGSTSTLLGAFFLGMSDCAAGMELDAAAVQAMFAGGLANVQKQTQAKPGDKTMIDALVPAVEAICASASGDIGGLLSEGAQAARQGADATVGMRANFGRARNYGERSVGHADAGASSWACLFAAFAEAAR